MVVARLPDGVEHGDVETALGHTKGRATQLFASCCQKLNTAGDGRGIEVRPSRSPGMRLPLESKAICAKDADMNTDSRVALPLGRRELSYDI